ncbi:MAG: hypothetical protein V4726_19195 [Verrucomicrobiota bacterium]
MNKFFSATGLCCLTLMPSHAAEIANSITEFSQTQGDLGWQWGWRNFTQDGSGDQTYNAVTAFLPFTPAQWNGNQFALGGNPPWTSMAAEAAHPNSAGNGAEHWVIRRWVATELTQVTPLRVTVKLRKQNPNGGGTTGALFQNGNLKFSRAVEGADSTGYELDYFLNVIPGDRIDFALTPVNFNGTRDDGADGSLFSMLVDDDLGAAPYQQPDGEAFTPASGTDSDGDNMPDFWELTYSNGGGLTVFKANGDFDQDGLPDPEEYGRASDPTKADTDGDGLSDKVETKNGNYIDANSTGTDPGKQDTDGDGLSDSAEIAASPATNPTKADTDGDTFSDSEEIFYNSSPVSGADTPLTQVIANSEADFSGVQGQDGWEYGYRDFTVTGPALNYDPVTAFTRFAGGSGNPDAWIEGLDSTQQWNAAGSKWDIVNGAPWTELSRGATHPNGMNNAVEHWSIRRWKAAELTAATPVDIIWSIKKTDPGGDGVTGAVFLNGKILDSRTIAGNNTTGIIRRVYLVMKPTDVVDFALSPVGLQQAHDGNDSSGTWLRVDKRIPASPVSSNGAFFAAPGAADTDGDGLADAWELFATADPAADPPVPGSLGILTASGTDHDQDGLTNLQEQARGSSPLKADTDGDGLGDAAETATGVYVSAADTGSSVLLADTDGDGLSDSAEVNAVQLRSNPWLANSDGDIYNDASELRRDGDPGVTTEYSGEQVSGGLAHSILDFGSSQGPSWFYGYRDLKADGGAENYNPVTDFIPIEFGTNWAVGGNPPWTSLWADGAHPNGLNAGANTDVHWALRRWVADPDTFPAAKPLAFWWHVRKQGSTSTDGITGSLYLNGKRLDSAGIMGTDTQGITRIVYADIAPGDKVDFALQANGPGLGFMEGYDYSDGSFTTLRVSEVIPAGAVQPDGTAFPPVSTAGFRIASITRNAGTGAVTVTWPSENGKTYDLLYSETMAAGSWQALTPAAGLAGTGAVLSFTDTVAATAQPTKKKIFYRVMQR